MRASRASSICDIVVVNDIKNNGDCQQYSGITIKNIMDKIKITNVTSSIMHMPGTLDTTVIIMDITNFLDIFENLQANPVTS
jgi:hypothetical protein